MQPHGIDSTQRPGYYHYHWVNGREQFATVVGALRYERIAYRVQQTDPMRERDTYMIGVPHGQHMRLQEIISAA